MERVVDPLVPVAQVSHAKSQFVAFIVMVIALALGPHFVYPVFLMKALCFALFACAYNLLIGYAGLISFGHAAFLGRRQLYPGLALGLL